MAKKKKKYAHGGARPGAGRKPKQGPTAQVTVRLPEVMREFLEEGEETMSDKVVAMFYRDRKFKDWLKSR